jgi:hypothetical protein
LTTLFGIESVPAIAVIQAPAAAPSASSSAKKNGWLPLLSILFLISYGLMTMLIVEQGRTIESQRALIHDLYHDSSELSAAKRALQDRSQSLTAPTQAPVSQSPSARVPSTQTPSSQTLSKQSQATTQAPSSQAGPQTQRAQNQSTKTSPEFKMPSKPEPDLVDDVRTLNII